MEKDNANPTILNTSQLPTRQRKKGRRVQRNAESKISSIIPRPQYLSDIFNDVSGSDDTESDGEFTAEPIDEQEVYGEISPVRISPSIIGVPISVSMDDGMEYFWFRGALVTRIS